MEKQDEIDMLHGRRKRLQKDMETYTHALSRYPSYLLSAVTPDKDYPLRRSAMPQFLSDYRDMLSRAEETVQRYWQTEQELADLRARSH